MLVHRAGQEPLVYLFPVHGTVATKISKVAGSGNLNAAGMMRWCSSTAHQNDKGDYDPGPIFNIQSHISNLQYPLRNLKSQAPNPKVSGVGFQVSGEIGIGHRA